MPQFIKRPTPVEAIQWFKVGDHPEVVPLHGEYGWIRTPKGGTTVNPGDWIVNAEDGFQVYGVALFKNTFMSVE